MVRADLAIDEEAVGRPAVGRCQRQQVLAALGVPDIIDSILNISAFKSIVPMGYNTFTCATSGSTTLRLPRCSTSASPQALDQHRLQHQDRAVLRITRLLLVSKIGLWEQFGTSFSADNRHWH
jgi:hypothetical protein